MSIGATNDDPFATASGNASDDPFANADDPFA